MADEKLFTESSNERQKRLTLEELQIHIKERREVRNIKEIRVGCLLCKELRDAIPVSSPTPLFMAEFQGILIVNMYSFEPYEWEIVYQT